MTAAPAPVLPERPTTPQRSGRIDRHLVRGLVVLVAIMLLAVNLRTAIAVTPPLLNRISGPLGISGTLAGVLGALPPIAFALGGLLTPFALRRRSGEGLAVLALLLTAAGQLARSAANGVGLYLLASIAALAGIAIGNVVASALVKAWFPRHIGGVTALYVTGITLGTAVPAYLAVPLADAGGWRLPLAVWGVVAAACVLPWLVVARHPRALPHTPTTPGDDVASLPPLSLLRSRTAWAMSLVFGMTALNIYSMIAWLPVRLTDAGLSDAQAGAQLALYTLLGVPPALLVPLMAQRMRSHHTLIIAFAVMFGAGYVGLWLAPTTLTWLWSSLSGLGGGCFPLMLTLFALRTRTSLMAGVVSGFAQGRGYAVAALGPLGFGLLHEATGGWAAPFAMLGVTLVLMVTGALLLIGNGHLEDELAR